MASAASLAPVEDRRPIPQLRNRAHEALAELRSILQEVEGVARVHGLSLGKDFGKVTRLSLEIDDLWDETARVHTKPKVRSKGPGFLSEEQRARVREIYAAHPEMSTVDICDALGVSHDMGGRVSTAIKEGLIGHMPSRR